jgi:hypothetical protein
MGPTNTSISEHDLLPVGPILVATLILGHVLKEYINSKTNQYHKSRKPNNQYHKSRKPDTWYFSPINPHRSRKKSYQNNIFADCPQTC